MKKITFIMMGLLLLLGGVKADPVNLDLSGGQNVSCADKGTYTEVTFNHNSFNGKWNGYYGNDWVTTLPLGKKHRFVFTFNSGVSSDLTLHFVVTTELDWNNVDSKKIIDETISEGATSFQYDVETEYGGVFLINTGTNGAKLEVLSVTREEIGGGGGGSALEGKTAVSYGIPHEVNTAMYTYTFDNGDYISTTGFSSTNNSSTDENYQSSKNLWLKNDVKPDYSKVNAWDSQVYIDLDSSEWPVGTKAILHFAMKSSTDFNANGGTMEIAFQQNSDGNYTKCGVFSAGMVPTNEWEEYNLETTVTDDAKCEKLYFNCGNFSGEFRFDDIILYKVEEAATGGDTHFTTDDQVANIASTEFSGLTKGDYICADVTGTPGTIKLVCNGTDYPLTQFNGGTLWGIEATDEMVTALQANDSQFKGHDLTLNGINIYKTVALGEGANEISLYNNVFVKLTRSFVADNWNTVCLPFVPTPAQANELFGSDYQLAEFTDVYGTTMKFTTASSFVAGKPYLVMPKTGCATGTTVLFDVNITAKNPTPVTWGDYTFTGTFTTKEFSGDECNTSRFVASGNELKKPNNNTTLKSLRCYFTVLAAATARSLSFDVDEEGGTTSINTVQGSGVMVNGYYNLAGQRVAQPTKGLYIVNGKKVVIK